MIVNSANLAAAAKGFRVLYKESLGAVESIYQKLAMVVPSDAPEETYAWLGELPRMREWIGDRVIKGLKAHGFTIRKKDWELTISVSRDEIQFDRLGLVKPRIQMMGQAAGQHYDELLLALIVSGFDALCFDGQYFFDADHPVKDKSVSNVTDKPFSATAYGAARAAMLSLVGENDNPLGIRPTHLVVPPQLEMAANEVLVSERTAAGATNPYRGSAELIVTPWLAAHPTKWFLLDLSKAVKPFIVQVVRKPDQLVALDQVDDANVFLKKEFWYGIDGQDNAGFGLWQLAYGSTGDGQA